MFSGIVEGKGELIAVRSYKRANDETSGMRIKVNWGCLRGSDAKIGDSVSVNGVCLTIVETNTNNFEADVSGETLSKTVGMDKLGVVNLEKAIRYSDRIGGHLVTGHIDGIATIIMITSTNNSKKLDILIPSSFGKFVTEKGSIALNGVSLTVNSLKDNDEGCLISVNLVPHTWSKTSFAELKINSKINFEIDLIARNLCRLLQDRKFLTECLNVKK